MYFVGWFVKKVGKKKKVALESLVKKVHGS
jgi:hypothetical protein